jgi:hypothetical protein
VVTGHAEGVITLSLDETDPVHREQMRVTMGEPYRTVLGHMRHEVAHYYQPIVAAPGSDDERCSREVFGDERADYQAAMDAYYQAGPSNGWEQSYVSAYATMHPWEDWAETFAHYLHIRDTLQTAAAYGLHSDGPSIPTADEATLTSDPEDSPSDVRSMLRAWVPLTYALNAVSRSMGAPDLYPFILTPVIEHKLTLITNSSEKPASPHDLTIPIRAAREANSRSRNLMPPPARGLRPRPGAAPPRTPPARRRTAPFPTGR